MVDKIFKIGILLLGAVSIFLYHSNASKGRYEMYQTKQRIIVLDTQNGISYHVTTYSGKPTWGVVNLINGESFNITSGEWEPINKY